MDGVLAVGYGIKQNPFRVSTVNKRSSSAEQNEKEVEAKMCQQMCDVAFSRVYNSIIAVNCHRSKVITGGADLFLSIVMGGRIQLITSERFSRCEISEVVWHDVEYGFHRYQTRRGTVGSRRVRHTPNRVRATAKATKDMVLPKTEKTLTL